MPKAATKAAESPRSPRSSRSSRSSKTATSRRGSSRVARVSSEFAGSTPSSNGSTPAKGSGRGTANPKAGKTNAGKTARPKSVGVTAPPPDGGGVALADPPAVLSSSAKVARVRDTGVPTVSMRSRRRTSQVARAPLSKRPMEEIWREYREAPTESMRNFLVERYHDVVRFTAERMHMKLPSEVDVDDLMSAGLFGLMDAIEHFDPDRGVKFETYCAQRIRGAIFDELRAMDWVPRLVRSRTAKVDRVRKMIEMETGRRPTDDEVCARLNVSKSEFEKLSKDSRPVGVVSLNRKCFESDSSRDVREIDVIRDVRQENPVQVIQKQDLQTLMTRGLSRAERLILILYYYEEMTMKEIGTTLDLSESRVSQMHSSILARLKAQMQHRTKDL
jgi:RNA polymerase sigma factor for flagellar operon FliA